MLICLGFVPKLWQYRRTPKIRNVARQNSWLINPVVHAGVADDVTAAEPLPLELTMMLQLPLLSCSRWS